MLNIEWIAYLVVLISSLYLNNIKQDLDTESVDMGDQDGHEYESYKFKKDKSDPLILNV